MTESSLELAARSSWAIALLGECIGAARSAGWLGASPGHDGPKRAIEAPSGGEPTPMSVLRQRFALSPGDLDTLWLLVTAELDPHVWRAASTLLNGGTDDLTVQIVQHVMCDGEALERLEKNFLIEIERDHRIPLHRRSVRAHDRVLDLARGQFRLDQSLDGIATLRCAMEALRSSAHLDIEVPQRIRAAFAHRAAFVALTGTRGTGRATVLERAMATSGRSVLTVGCAELATDPSTLTRQLRAIARECVLHDAWPLFRECDVLCDRMHLVERELLSRLQTPVGATAAPGWTLRTSRQCIISGVGLPERSKRERLWRCALPATATDELAAECAARFNLAPALVSQAARSLSPEHCDLESVQHAVRAQLDRDLAGLATRVETRQTWDDLVLPIDQFDLLIELVARVRHRNKVLDEWGFAEKVGRGLGVTTLMSGPPGTGKTMIAGLVARELGLDLYQVDMSKVTSKFIGETEKHLSKLFDAAESGHVVLLFDEADSLFAKRTEVKSSNDRYANLEVNYLLQRLEAFTGITILTTNHESAIDPAFLRRLAFHIRIPMPDEGQRELLWKAMFPTRAHLGKGLELAEVARSFAMSGGYIKNAALRAAFLAANEDKAITNEHVWRAARAEYEATGKVTIDAAYDQ